jgi:predicted nucleic acid-binding protein
MLYFDTSFLVPLVHAEPTSDRIQRFFRRQRAGTLAISQWTWLEFSSALARDVRMGVLSRETALAADRQFDVIVEESFIVLLPDADDFTLAKQYVQRYGTGLRSGDAFHLAIAGNHGASAIYSLDKRLRRAGKKLRLPVRSGIQTR